MNERGSWLYDEATGKFQAQPKADYSAAVEEQVRRMIDVRDRDERDARRGHL